MSISHLCVDCWPFVRRQTKESLSLTLIGLSVHQPRSAAPSFPSMSMRAPRGRSPVRSPRESGVDRDATLRRTVSPRSISRSPSFERDAGRRNGHYTNSPSQSPLPPKKHSRSRSRTWSRDSRRYRNRSYSRSQSPPGIPRSSKVCWREPRLSSPGLTDAQMYQIVVEKLTKNVTESHLREIFAGFGEIQSLDLPMNKACMSHVFWPTFEAI